MNCCARCFGDRGFRRNIFPLRSNERGLCSYCEANDVPVLAPPVLSEYFELLISAYHLDPQGKLLIDWFREDWNMFTHPSMDDLHAAALLSEILGNKEILTQKFSPTTDAKAERLSEWEKLRDELMYKNRFFPETNFDENRMEFLFSQLEVDAEEIPSEWYRARIQAGDSPFKADEMGAPPKRNALHGRANPAGIPYLYLASTHTIAVCEIRPHTGAIACVANFAIPENLRLVDLRSPRGRVSPFILEDAADIGKMRSDLPFLERLGEELTRPVLPDSAAIDYTPSQYVCEFIKKCRFDGVIYRSSMGDGMNLALFDPKRAKCGKLRRYRVSRVSAELDEIDES